MKKYLSIILALLLLLFSPDADARKKKHRHRKVKARTHIRVAPAPPRIVDGICGIDVSHYQGTIDWDKVTHYENNPIRFVYVKATEGATIKDECYNRNVMLAKEKGLLVGSYHYFSTKTSAEEQFENFKQTVNKDTQDLIPVVDIEECKYWTDDVLHKNLQIFLNEVEALYGKKPVLYTMPSFYNRYLVDRYKDYKIFIAQYGDGNPVLPDGNNWHIWQYTRRGRIDGIRGDVDVNAINPECDHNEILLNGLPDADKSTAKKEQTPNPVPITAS